MLKNKSSKIISEQLLHDNNYLETINSLPQLLSYHNKNEVIKIEDNSVIINENETIKKK